MATKWWAVQRAAVTSLPRHCGWLVIHLLAACNRALLLPTAAASSPPAHQQLRAVGHFSDAVDHGAHNLGCLGLGAAK